MANIQKDLILRDGFSGSCSTCSEEDENYSGYIKYMQIYIDINAKRKVIGVSKDFLLIREKREAPQITELYCF